MTGQTFSHYRILHKLGEGGMGEVYLAQDTILEREVAVKFLPREFEQDPLAGRRFRREAQACAGLDHPFIAQIHEIGEEAGRSFLVMEYLRGQTLRERLAEGPIPLDDALRYAAEIAEALHAAHSENIVHRDLKPSNIMITRSGHVKVMDFGLAKVVNSTEERQHDQNVTGLTGSGVRLGTVPYMSPEQLKGSELDTRSDIFSFGILLYEMVTGRHPFRKGETFETASSILKDPPPPLPPLEPEGVVDLLSHVLRKMLAKRPEDRYQSALDLRIDLEEVRSRADGGRLAVWRAKAGNWRFWLLLGLGVPILALFAGWWFGVWGGAGPATPLRFEVNLPAGLRLAHYYRQAMALSPDGRVLAVTAGRLQNPYIFPDEVRIYTRHLDQWRFDPVPGSENGFQPVYSPDGEWLAFTRYEPAANRYSLVKVRLNGGEPVTLCECDARWGVAWSPHGYLLLGSPTAGLLRVGESGGPVEPVELDPGARQTRILPSVSPDGEVVFYTVPRDPDALAGEARIWAWVPATGEHRELVDGWDGRYVPTGHLVFGRGGTLKGLPFHLGRLEPLGPEVTLIEGVTQSLFTVNTTLRTGALQMAFSSTGLLAYTAGSVFPEIKGPLAWVDRQGKEELLEVEPRNYHTVRISPDGTEVLLTSIYPPQDIWLFEPLRRSMRRQTFEGSNMYAIWGPEPDQITFAVNRSGRRSLWTKPVDRQAVQLSSPESVEEGFLRPGDWSPDGRTLAVVQYTESARFDVLMLAADGTLNPFLNSEFSEQYPQFSPDGRWLVYSSNESGRQEVYVRPYPGPGRTLQVSTEGGIEPAWSRDGKEILYRWRREFFAARVHLQGERPTAERPRRLFEGDYGSAFAVRSFDVAPDGRLLVVKRPDEAAILAAVDQFFPTRVQFVEHWFTDLSQRAPRR